MEGRTQDTAMKNRREHDVHTVFFSFPNFGLLVEN